MTKQILHDARKRPVSRKDESLLQWGFYEGVPGRSVQMPTKVVDQILLWRDASAIAKAKGE